MIEEVIDSVRRIISKWVNTLTPLAADVNPNNTIITVDSVNRFKINDDVMFRTDALYETGLKVKTIVGNTHIELDGPAKFQWKVSDDAVLIKAINNRFVQGIYFGDPDNIPVFPAITVVGNSRSSEWMTLNTTKERYEIEITVYVEDSTQEEGYRFLLAITDIIQAGLKRNIFPLISDYQTIAVTASIASNDTFIKVADTTGMIDNMRCYLEDRFNFAENFVSNVVDATTIELAQPACFAYPVSRNPILILPTRFIFNSWPEGVQYTKVHKGTLLKAATISWFAEEEEFQFLARHDPQIS